jgi:hypothetical protein
MGELLNRRRKKEKASAWWKKANAQCAAEAFRAARNTPSGIPSPRIQLIMPSQESARPCGLNGESVDAPVPSGELQEQSWLEFFRQESFSPCFYLTFAKTR